MKLGTTLAYPHLRYLGLDLKESLVELLNLDIKILRLGVYWSKSEKEKNKYDYKVISEILTFCDKHEIDVVLTFGMKAPRWPEFYIPKWLNNNTENTEPFIYDFIKNSLIELGSFKSIKYIQVENEPLDPSGPDSLVVPLIILKKEVALVRSISKLPIILNLWGNEISKRIIYLELIGLANVIGIDLYYKTPWTLGYRGPRDSDKKIKEIFGNIKKPLWITELQAEPWEKSESLAHSDNPRSMNENQLKKNFTRAKKLDPEAILLWGFEYWLMRKAKNDTRLYDAVKEISVG